MNPSREITDSNIQDFMRCYQTDDESIMKYKLYGPANPLIDGGCQYSDDGICYMMTCGCFEKGEWYVGYCLECKEIIASKKYAWRNPLINGAFIGCYCKNHFRMRIEKSEDADEDEEDSYSNLCDIMEMVRDHHPIVDHSHDENICLTSEEWM